VQSRHDESYCTNYTTSEKRAIAEQILRHIKSLDPPGRFLKRIGRAPSSRGLHGPWEELSDREAVKKTCQALRDCNRTDRIGYAAAVNVPDDVRRHAESRSASGLSNKEQAAIAAASKTRTEGAPPAVAAPLPVALMNSAPHQTRGVIAQGSLPPMHYHHGMPLPPPGAAPIHMPVPISLGMPIRPDVNTTSHNYSPPPGQPLPVPPTPPQSHMHYHPVQVHPPPPHMHRHQYQSIYHPPHPDQYHHRQLVTHLHFQPVQDQEATQQLHGQAPSPRLPQAEGEKRSDVSMPPGTELRISRNGYEDVESLSPAGNPTQWSKTRKPLTVETGAQPESRTNPSPSSSTNNTSGYVADNFLVGYVTSASSRTPSQETCTTSGTTPTTDESRAQRPSLSPTAAMHPSSSLAYDRHHGGGVDPSLYSRDHEYSEPPTPTASDQHHFGFLQQQHGHTMACSGPSAEMKHTYTVASEQHIDQQLQAAAEAAAAAVAASDGQTEGDYASASPNPYHDHHDSLFWDEGKGQES